MSNIFQQVITYQASQLGLLQNSFCLLSNANKKYRNFDTLTANLGDTVSFVIPPRMTTVPSLVATYQNTQQLVQYLTVDQPASSSYSFTSQEFIFNADQFMESYGQGAVASLGTQVESNIALNAINNTYRFYGNGVDPINSYQQLSQALANFRDYGAANYSMKGYLPLTDVPAIIGSGLNQFALDRNNKIANSWELGQFSQCDWYQSNLLQVHTAGTIGESGVTLTFVSINPTGDQITFSGAPASDANAVKKGDLFQFLTPLFFRTYVGYSITSQKVQFAATADAASDGSGNVTISITQPLIATSGVSNQSISRPITTSDTVKGVPSHRAGMIVSGDALYLAMPKLPVEHPYASVSEMDPDSGASLRLTYGAVLGQNQIGFINSVIWGSTLVPQYAMRLVFPLQ
jgi:hypothetical protein